MKKLLFILVPIILLILILLFQANNLILGGEGNYFLDIKAVQNLYGSAWFSLGTGTGSPNPLVHQTFGLFPFISLLQTIAIPPNVINLLLIFLIYYLPFLSMFILLYSVLHFKFRVSLLVSLFYILNPFSIIHFQFLMFWNIAPFIVFPLAFAIIHRFYRQQLYLFSIFGIFSLAVAFAFENIPYLVLFHIFLPIAVILSSYFQDSPFELRRAAKNYLIILFSFFLFSTWWLLPLIRFQLQDLTYDSSNAIDYVKTSLGERTFLWRLLTFKTYISEVDKDFITSYFNNVVVNVLLLIPFGLLVYGYFSKRIKGSKVIIPTILLFAILFLNKGSTEPFGAIYLFFLEKVPLFFIFKTPLEKFSVLTVFLFSILIAMILRYRGRLFYAFFILYLVICSVPFFTLNFIPDYPIHKNNVVSKQFIDKSSYQEFRSAINADSFDSRLLSLPGSTNYQITMYNHDNKFYRGLDPLLFSVNKPFMASYWATRFDSVYTNLASPYIGKLLGLYNVHNIVLNHDIYPSFGVKEKETQKQLETILSKTMKRKSYGPISVFKNPSYVPHVYSATSVINTVSGPDILPSIILNKDFSVRSAIIQRRSIASEIDQKLQSLDYPLLPDEEPTIEFKKINPSKYTVRIHGAKKNFLLVFAEEFHPAWKLYLPNYENKIPSMTDLNLYKSFEQEEHQATKADVEKFIKDSKISELKTGNSMKFISTNYQSSIQNENLSDLPIWLTTNSVKIYNESNHVLVNGYANAWLIDLNELCSSSKSCSKNSDGTTDITISLGFWPEQLRIIGILVTITITGLSLLIVAVQVLRKKTL